MKNLLLATVAGMVLSTAAYAVPTTMSIEVFDGASLIYQTPVASTTGAVGLLDFAEGKFSSITVSATGIPKLPSPDLSSITLDVQSTGPSTLTVLVTQTGATVPAPTKLLSTFTLNGLTAHSGSSVDFSNWISATNLAFKMDTLIATATLDPIVTTAGPIISGVTPTLFSETEKYVINFTGGNQSVSLTSQIIDAPEPASAAMIGVGMLGLGYLRRSRRNVAPSAA